MPTSYSGAYAIPEGIESIAGGAFYGCIGLTSVTIPNSVTSIGEGAFGACSGLRSVTIPNSVTSIGDRAFSDVPNIAYSGSATGSPWGARSLNGFVDGWIVYNDETKTNLLACSSAAIGEITIPNSVTSIGNGAFDGCSGLTSVTIPNSVTSIDGYTFYGCTGLTSVTIPNSVISIGVEAFYYCTGLTSVTIPNSVTWIGEFAFGACSGLKEVKYPKGLDLSKVGIPSSTKLIACDGNTPPHQQSNPSQPPLLAMQEGTFVFSDATHNNIINAAEQCYIRFKIKNSGKGTANNCEARVKLSGSTSGIKVQNVKLPAIAVGQTYEVSIPITTDINTQDGKVTFSIDVYEPNGWGVAPFDLTIATKAFEAPFLQVVDYQTASNSGKIKKMEPFTLTFNLQNTQYGDAEQVKVKVNLPANIFVMDGSAEQSFAQIKSGETKTITLTLAANNNYPSTDIPVTIDVKERYGKFAENKQLNIALNQTTSSSINIAAKDEPQQERKEIQLAMITADVDRNIPKTDIQNQNTFVVIIANENYQQVASVPFALNDGKIFRQYCEQTLGIPAKNIREQTNATGNQLKAQINWLRNVVEIFDNPNIIFYYAGHGIPDEASKTAYLLPVDGILSDLSTCYKLDDLYATLGEMPAGHISVFMDACFSGSKREQGMLASARGVALKARPGEPKGNMVVFSAATGDETAYPYTAKQHGLFTYYLLKKLQDTKGDVTLQELGNYVVSEVKKQSVLENNKTQTPTITPAHVVADSWQTWKLK